MSATAKLLNVMEPHARNEALPRLLRAMASGSDYQKHGHDMILNLAADEIERLRKEIESLEASARHSNAGEPS